MFDSLGEILSIIENYKYLVIVPIVILEGPITIIICGFLVHLGYLNPYVAYPILVFADVAGDSIYHTIGRYWQKAPWATKFSTFIGYSEKNKELLENYFKKHIVKTILFAKFAHGIGRVIIIASGIARINYLQFLGLSVGGTIPKTLILMLIGYYAGSSIGKIDNFLSAFAIITLSIFVVIIVLYVLINKYMRKFFRQE